jgi:predicted aminopeptidase
MPNALEGITMPPIIRLVRLVATILLGASLSGCYVLQQGLGQARLLLARKSVQSVLADSSVKPEAKAKLRLILEAKAYAENVIGLKKTANYEFYVQLSRNAVSYVVGAAPKDKLAAYTWWFPVIGDVPYKGYFDRQDALKEKQALETRGFDALVRNVPAFSTLGFLPDPVYSPFLQYDEVTISNIIIHETTHATLFLPGNASFNEGFATFVGNEGALAFLTSRFGSHSKQVQEAQDQMADNTLFTPFIHGLASRLNALYASPISHAEKLKAREAIFMQAQQNFNGAVAPRMHGGDFGAFGHNSLNNAVVISYLTYYNRLDRFESAFNKQHRSLRATVAFFKNQVAKAPDPEKYLDDYLARP